MAERILVLEGPKGTAIQTLGLSEEDFRGDLLRDHPKDVQGDNDLLGLTRPDIVEAIHRDYVAAGAWIVSTNTFNASPVSQSEYGLEHLVYEMNKAAAETARRALDGADDRFVVGSVGPTNRTLSISPQVEDPAFQDRLQLAQHIGAQSPSPRTCRSGSPSPPSTRADATCRDRPRRRSGSRSSTRSR